MIEDAELLRRYAATGAEDAFEELVRRRLDLVYSVALRQVGGDAHLAEDITQSVFADLARKAPQLSQRQVLSGWLYRSTQFAASDVVRSERRRRTREQESQTMSESTTLASRDVDWQQLRPLLDQTMGKLDEDDRDALALRYFEDRSFAEIGGVLRLTEDTARKRVDRALDKMAGLLARHGITSPATALGLALAHQVGAAPAGLVASITASSLATISAGTATTAASWSVLNFMSMTKTISAVAGLAALVGGGAWYQASREAAQASAERDALVTRVAALETQLHDEKQRAETAEAESTTLLKAIEAARLAKVTVTPHRAQATEPATPGVTTTAPAGWGKNGSKPEAFAVGVDKNEMWNGMPSAYARSLEGATGAFGGMMQGVSAEAYRGKRVRLSGWMKTQDANDGGGHLWLRVDGEERGKMLEFDNMNNRAPKGTTNWQPYSVVLDVGQDARALAYGFFLEGKGQMWLNGTKIEEVGADVPKTNMMTGPNTTLPKKPENLTFQ